ncbi:MAG: transposase [Sedimentisphaerales bacterium]
MNHVSTIEKAHFWSMKQVLINTFIDQEGLIMIIDNCPRFLRSFFNPIQPYFSKPQFNHFWAIILALIIRVGRANVQGISEVLPRQGHRTSHGHFLAKAKWNAPAVLDDRVWAMIRRMRPKTGETICLLLDDTRNAKRGKKMANLSKIWDHTHQRYVRGHIVVTGVVMFRGVVLPWRFVLYKPKKDAKSSYRKLTEIAADIIDEFTPPAGLKVRVLFDAYYLCPKVTKTCEKRLFTWFSVASKNRTFTRVRAGKRKISDFAPGFLRHNGRNVRMPRSGGWAILRIAWADGRLARIGKVRMVVSKRPCSPWKTMVCFVSNETNLGAREIVSIYEKRWAVEVLFKELRGELGLGDYQVLSEAAILKHLHLCGLAHLVLTHHSLEAVGAQARKANVEVALPSMSQRLKALRSSIRHEQIKRIVKIKNHKNLVQKLNKYLLAA